MFFCLFFFQAEDGIRDLVWSRGLGDVYGWRGMGGAGEQQQVRLACMEQARMAAPALPLPPMPAAASAPVPARMRLRRRLVSVYEAIQELARLVLGEDVEFEAVEEDYLPSLRGIQEKGVEQLMQLLDRYLENIPKRVKGLHDYLPIPELGQDCALLNLCRFAEEQANRCSTARKTERLCIVTALVALKWQQQFERNLNIHEAVPYPHLTLPTILRFVVSVFLRLVK